MKVGSTTTIVGSLSSTQPQPTTYFVEFFRTPSCTGQPQGQKYLGFKSVTIDEGQTATFSFGSDLPGLGDEITATATNSVTNDTSEFSNCEATVAGSGLLQGSVVVDPPVTPVDLTARGTTDWAIWGYAAGGTSTSLAPDTRKAGGSAISDLTNIDPAPSVQLRGLGQFANPPFLFDWTDGNSPNSDTNATGGLQHNGEPQDLSTLGKGFAFDVPADTSPRTLTVYVATNRADGELTATLSDGSASAFSDTLVQAVDLRSGVYTITYAAASANQTLHVSWVETVDNCVQFRCDNAAIYAVALSAGLPVNIANLSLTADADERAGGRGAGQARRTSRRRRSSAAVEPADRAGEPDAGQPDAGQPARSDLGPGQPDSREPDAGQPDARQPDRQLRSTSRRRFRRSGASRSRAIPLLRTGGWAAILAGTSLAGIPEQNVTLSDVYALNLDHRARSRRTRPTRSRSPTSISRGARSGGCRRWRSRSGTLPLSSIPTLRRPGRTRPGARRRSCRASTAAARLDRPLRRSPGRAREPDAGQPDARQPDADRRARGRLRAGQPDAGEPDAGQPDAGSARCR